jgi:hypothetical protein
MNEVTRGQQWLQSPSKASSAQRHAVLILGMHRGGTSALAGVTSALGVAGPKTPIGPTTDNLRGYFECAPLGEAHDALLASAGSCWHDWRQLDARWFCSTAAEGHRQRIKELLVAEYGDRPLIYIKDPRVCRFVPFISSILVELNISPVAILPIRNPLEVAYSLRRRDSFLLPKSILLWLRHMLDAEFHSRQMPRCFVPYEEFLRNWKYDLDGVGKKIGIVWPNSSDSSNVTIGEFLSPDLRHEKVSFDEMKKHPDVFPLAVETYNALSKIAVEGESPEILDQLDLIRTKFDEGCQIFGAAVTAEETAIANGLIAERDALAAAHNRLVSEHRAIGREHESCTAERNVLIATCDSLIAERDTVAAARDDLISERDTVAAARDDLISERDALVRVQLKLSTERDTVAAAYNRLSTEYDAILTSRSWRATAPLRRLRSFWQR